MNTSFDDGKLQLIWLVSTLLVLRGEACRDSSKEESVRCLIKLAYLIFFKSMHDYFCTILLIIQQSGIYFCFLESSSSQRRYFIRFITEEKDMLSKIKVIEDGKL